MTHRAARWGFTIADEPRPAVSIDDAWLDLTPMAARILTRVIDEPGFVANAALLGTKGRVPNTATLRVHVAAIRKVLPERFTLLNEAPGGYRLITV